MCFFLGVNTVSLEVFNGVWYIRHTFQENGTKAALFVVATALKVAAKRAE